MIGKYYVRKDRCEKRPMESMYEDIDDLKSFTEEQFCSRDKTLEEACQNLSQKFRKQTELQLTNELKKQSKIIKAMLWNYILESKKQNLQEQQEFEVLGQCGGRLTHLRRVKSMTRF